MVPPLPPLDEELMFPKLRPLPAPTAVTVTWPPAPLPIVVRLPNEMLPLLEVSVTVPPFPVDGPPLVTTRLAIEATEDASKFRASGAIPIGALPPGDYVVRALVGIQDKPFGRVIKTIRKVAK